MAHVMPIESPLLICSQGEAVTNQQGYRHDLLSGCQFELALAICIHTIKNSRAVMLYGDNRRI